jgi:dihydrofolate reductase
MAKLISTLFIAVDGVAEIDPDWHFPYFDENMGRAVGEDYNTSDVLLLGRETYDSFAGAWPGREAAGGDDASFARQLGDVRKIVVSRQPLEFSWRNSEPIDGDLIKAVTALKVDPGITGILVPGSISVVQQLLTAGLVDELRLLVHPVAARKGRRLFDDGDTPYHLALIATEVFPTGVIVRSIPRPRHPTRSAMTRSRTRCLREDSGPPTTHEAIPQRAQRVVSIERTDLISAPTQSGSQRR